MTGPTRVTRRNEKIEPETATIHSQTAPEGAIIQRMTRHLSITLSLAVACLVSGCGRQQPGWPYYTLALNAGPAAQDRQFAPNDPGACVYVNGNPVGIFPRENTIIVSLNQYLRPGTNVITLTDSARRSWNMGVAWISKEDQAALVDTNFDVADKPFTVSLNLTNVAWSLPLFNNAISINDISGNNILRFVQRLYTFSSAPGDTNRADALNLLRQDGIDVWQPAAYDVSDEMLAKELITARNNMDNVASFIELPKPETLKIIRGPNAIVVYTGIAATENGERAYLARMRLKDGAEKIVPELVLYRKNGGWAVWQ